MTEFVEGETLRARLEHVDRIEIADRLAHLVERSIVVADGTTERRTRYRMLETLRQFGRDRLIAGGDMTRVRDQHLAWAVAAHARDIGLATIGELGATTYPEAIAAGVRAFVHTSRYSLELAAPDVRANVAAWPFGPPRIPYYEYLASVKADDPALARCAATLGASGVALIPTLSLSYLDLPGHRHPWTEPVARPLDPADINLPADRKPGSVQSRQLRREMDNQLLTHLLGRRDAEGNLLDDQLVRDRSSRPSSAGTRPRRLRSTGCGSCSTSTPTPRACSGRDRCRNTLRSARLRPASDRRDTPAHAAFLGVIPYGVRRR